ncbi:TetR/AcrR family transcriptional regulator [Agromyces bauzanensis]|uniref:TetR family transcriptional regulator n=1 Tax=Agromyces bauzanensis TaxID=1308924 RepID=A0A917PLM1_9MICO|nr:TetR/AcrR family transcriptional regulator [Agromyces bauzanensis]GGJ83490.1 TetR family transcriptional regulator [Agromyces bauzanensis]
MPRADAQRNIDALLAAAKAEFLTNGVDVSVRAIAARAGVGTATLYRHFPTRADLISAVFHKAIDALTEAANDLAAAYPPDAALERWVHGYIDFVATKHGLAGALYSGDPAFNGLREHFETRIGPTLQRLLDEAEHVRAIRPGIDPLDLLGAVANLCIPPPDSTDTSRPYRMVALLLDGLRYGAASRPSASA